MFAGTKKYYTGESCTMAKKNRELTDNTGIYRKSPGWRVALSQLSINMCFYAVMSYVSYIANIGYGIATALVGVLITFTNIFDGITDPLIAIVIENVKTKHGKIRILLVSGWLIAASSIYLMFFVASTGHMGVVVFMLLYMLYIIGYTVIDITGRMMGPVMTNDPKQRPVIGVWNTIYSYLTPTILMLVITMVILPKYGNEFTLPMLKETALLCLAISAVFMLIVLVAVSKVDVPESFEGTVKSERIKFKDMIGILKTNKPLQCYIAAVASDKVAQQASAQAVVSTMLYGILIGNMQIGTLISMGGMLVGIIFAVIAAKNIGKIGGKEANVLWTKVCIVISVLTFLFYLIVDMKTITVSLIPTIIFIVLTIGSSGAKMCVTTACTSMMGDVIDYELNETGKYTPALITATYSFIDKIIGAFGASIALGLIALVGYSSRVPQPTDAATPAIFWITMVILFFLPIAGWVITLFAMKKNPISKEKMVEIQASIAEKKATLAENA